MDRALRGALRQALEQTPGSIRELAREVGVEHSTLIRLREGDWSVTPEMAARLVAALRRYAARCEASADKLESAARKAHKRGR